MSTTEPNPPIAPAYDRILLKLSGEALMGNDAYGINRETVKRIVGEVKERGEASDQGGEALQ